MVEEEDEDGEGSMMGHRKGVRGEGGWKVGVAEWARGAAEDSGGTAGGGAARVTAARRRCRPHLAADNGGAAGRTAVA